LQGHIKLLRLLHESGAKQEVEGAIATPLHHAASAGHVESIIVLIELGAQVNALDREKWTPLLRAAAGGHREASRVLIARGADVSCVDHEGHTALHLAVIATNALCVTELVQVSGIARDATDASGDTALHKAARYGLVECAQALVNKGANINATYILDKINTKKK
jgi:ankyrin repeat protein